MEFVRSLTASNALILLLPIRCSLQWLFLLGINHADGTCVGVVSLNLGTEEA
jgi:hypothetical protein